MEAFHHLAIHGSYYFKIITSNFLGIIDTISYDDDYEHTRFLAKTPTVIWFYQSQVFDGSSLKRIEILVSFMVSIFKIPVRSGRYPPALWEFMANVYRDWKNWMFRAIDRQEKSSAYNGFLFPLAERQLIPTQSLHHQILEFLDLHLVLGVQVLTSLPRVIWTWMEKLLCWLNKKKIIKKKTQIGSQGHSYHCQRRLPFMNNLLENCPLVMDVASLRLSSMVISVIVVLLQMTLKGYRIFVKTWCLFVPWFHWRNDHMQNYFSFCRFDILFSIYSKEENKRFEFFPVSWCGFICGDFNKPCCFWDRGKCTGWNWTSIYTLCGKRGWMGKFGCSGSFCSCVFLYSLSLEILPWEQRRHYHLSWHWGSCIWKIWTSFCFCELIVASKHSILYCLLALTYGWSTKYMFSMGSVRAHYCPLILHPIFGLL